jgi:hypothetical protein
MGDCSRASFCCIKKVEVYKKWKQGIFSDVALSRLSTSPKNIKKTIQLPVELIERNTTRKD